MTSTRLIPINHLSSRRFSTRLLRATIHPPRFSIENNPPWQTATTLPLTTRHQQQLPTHTSPLPSLQKSQHVSKTPASYVSTAVLSHNNTNIFSASSRHNLHPSFQLGASPPRLPDELHLPPLLPLLLSPNNHNDHKRPIAKNPQPALKSPRLTFGA